MALVVAAACSGGTEAQPYVVRDSAGVEIVESYGPAWSESEAWRVAADPTLRIGVREGEPWYQFSGVVGGARLADGTVVVADGGSREVRFYEPDGMFARSVGGHGEGPGEFVDLSSLGHAPDGGVWAYDFFMRRFTWLTGGAEIARFSRVGGQPPRLLPVGALPDGSMVLKQAWGAQQAEEAERTGPRRDPVAYVVLGPDGTLRDTVGLFPGRDVIITTQDGRGVMNSPLFAINSQAALLGEHVVVGSGTTFELEVLTTSGQRIRRLRLPARDLAFLPGQVEAAIEERVAAAPSEQRAELRLLYATLPPPETRPAYGDLLSDGGGRLWVAEWTPEPRVPDYWVVFDSAGRWLGDVTMPPGFFPLDIGDEWLLGVQRDAFDVETVVLHALERPAGG